MGLINLLLKIVILLLDLRDTYDCLDVPRLSELGHDEREVLVRNADGSRQMVSRRRIGSSKRRHAVRSALTTVLVWNLFAKLEPLCDNTVAWFVPFYDSIKTLLLVWMLFTRSFGASILMYRLIQPVIRPYEGVIAGVLHLCLSLGGYAQLTFLTMVQQMTALMFRGRPQQPAQPVSATIDSSTRSKPNIVTSSMSVSKQHTAPGSKAQAQATLNSGPNTKRQSNNAARNVARSTAGVASVKGTIRGATHDHSLAQTGAQSKQQLQRTRKVLEELPVPSHPFVDWPVSDLGASAVLPSTSNSNGGTKKSNQTSPIVKKRSSSPPLLPQPSPQQEKTLGNGSSTARTGSASDLPNDSISSHPVPPAGSTLRNYAFIPGQTPPKAAISAISPTPKFPGAFGFSMASTAGMPPNNPFQAARVPITSTMPPLTFGSAMLGAGVGANDDQIVAPPGLRSKASASSLRGRKTFKETNTSHGPNPENSSASLGDLRSRGTPANGASSSKTDGVQRAEEEHGDGTDSATELRSPQKKARSEKAAGATAIARRKPATATTRDIAKRSGTASSSAVKATTRPTAAHVTKAGTASASTVARTAKTKTKTPSLTAKKTLADTASLDASDAPVSAPNSKSSSTTTAGAASTIPSRMTRSRTKQKLAD
ncbi:LOW QUALITY PROTEIN: hypothetical protein BCV70DRAFT_224781 [Testicularia cyperi]|uniref:Uncharacterized protein n=1 Tax=Testicularia cyperi TaxID=1882483 RepID=A0A317Y158_9BASI|nr:LOW QUALITY PROTEIN: hypothetical protein BCV70DRAFT_224781 [Testicularia cyperi]